MKRILALLGLCLVISGCQLPVIHVVSVKEATVRKGPSANTEEVTRVPFGEEVELIGYVNTKIYGERNIDTWGQISYNGQVGYLPLQSMLTLTNWMNQNNDVENNDYAKTIALRRFIDDESNLESSALRGAFDTAKLNAERAVEAMEKTLSEHPSVDTAALDAFKTEGRLASRWSPKLETHDISDAYDFGAYLFVPTERFLYCVNKPFEGLNVPKAQRKTRTPSSWSSLTMELVGDQLSRMNLAQGPLDEYRLAKGLLSRMLSDQKVLPADDPRSRYVEKVSGVLQMESVSPEAYDGMRVFLVEDATPNAVSLSGGMVAVTTGMLGLVRDEDELAAILAHEIAHEELSHGAKSVRAERAKWSVFSLVTDVGSALEFESEADLRALNLLASAGYDPMALHDIIERFKEQRQTYGGSTYPEERGRIVAEAVVRDGLPTGECGRAQRAERFNRLAGGAK